MIDRHLDLQMARTPLFFCLNVGGRARILDKKVSGNAYEFETDRVALF
jgi:hypothetical protein